MTAKIIDFKSAFIEREKQRAEREYRQWELSLSQVSKWTEAECERFMQKLYELQDEPA